MSMQPVGQGVTTPPADGAPPAESAAARRPLSVALTVFYSAIWLFWLGDPFADAWNDQQRARGVLGVIVLVVFAAVYVWHFVTRRSAFVAADSGNLRDEAGALLRYAVLVLLAVSAVLLIGQSGYPTIVFAALSALWTFPVPVGLAIGVATAGINLLLVHVVDGWTLDSGVLAGLGFGMIAITMGRVAARRQRQLELSRQVNAELLVVAERNRMARDLHDILGHSLTVITVKAELAGRLFDIDPAGARAQVTELEGLSRQALADVRSAVEGFREISLRTEIAGAAKALASAGIKAEVNPPAHSVPTDVGELFAWTIREATTNVIRHSGARHCQIDVAPATVTITDDGAGCPYQPEATGNGLQGLRERASKAGATLLTKTPAGGGFQLTMSVTDPLRKGSST